MVQNRWLSPQVVREHITRFSASRYLLQILLDDTRVDGMLALVRDLLRKVVRAVDRPEVLEFLDRTIKDQLNSQDLPAAVGRWIGTAIRRGQHTDMWETVLSQLEDLAESFAFRQTVRETLARAIEDLKKSDLINVSH